VSPYGSTFDRSSRVLGVVRGPSGVSGLVYTGLSASMRDHPGIPREEGRRRVGVIRCLDLDQGVRWEHPFPTWEAYDELHVVRTRDRIVLPGRERGELVALDLATGAVRWRWARDHHLRADELGLDTAGDVLALYGDRHFAVLDPDSGTPKRQGRHDEDDEPICFINPFTRASPDQLLVGDCRVRVEHDGFRVEERFFESDGYVVRLPGRLEQFLRGGEVHTRERDDGTEESWRSARVPYEGDLKLNHGRWFIDGDRVGLALCGVDYGDPERWTTGFSLYHLPGLRHVGSLPFGLDDRRFGEVEHAYSVDEVAVVHTYDRPLVGDDLGEVDPYRGYEAVFLIDLRSGTPTLLGRLTVDHRYPSRIFEGERERWIGVL